MYITTSELRENLATYIAKSSQEDIFITKNLLTKVKYFSSKMEYIFIRIFCVQQNDRRRFRPAGRSAMLY